MHLTTLPQTQKCIFMYVTTLKGHISVTNAARNMLMYVRDVFMYVRDGGWTPSLILIFFLNICFITRPNFVLCNQKMELTRQVIDVVIKRTCDFRHGCTWQFYFNTDFQFFRGGLFFYWFFFNKNGGKYLCIENYANMGQNK